MVGGVDRLFLGLWIPSIDGEAVSRKRAWLYWAVWQAAVMNRSHVSYDFLKDLGDTPEEITQALEHLERAKLTLVLRHPQR